MFKQAAAALLFASMLSPAAQAGGSYDGVWSVSLLTKSGDCDRSVVSQIQIRDGRVNENLLYARIVGNIGGNGVVSLQVVRGNDSLNAYGTVDGTRASGSWTAAGRNCTGSWTALKSV